MPSPLHFIAHRSARKFLNIRLGWQLMRDPKVPATKKFAAIVIGIAITAALMILQIPLEGILALVAPMIGLAADFAIDGIEVVVLPLLIATAILPFLHQARQLARAE